MIVEEPHILGIETSGRAGTIALGYRGEILGTKDLSASGRRHARTLVPEIKELLSDHEIRPMDVGAVAVSIGPGSFTGVRVGVVCAKTFAYIINCPIIGIDTFLCVAADQEHDDVWVIDDALRGDAFAGHYQRIGGNWNCLQSPHLVSIEEWKQCVGETIVTGPGVQKVAPLLDGLNTLPSTPQAEQVVMMAELRFQERKFDDAFHLVPHYIRRSAAEENADAAKA